MNNAFLGVAISMVLIFAILASAATAVTEAISRFIGLRAEYLLRGLRTLLAENNTFKLRLRAGKEEATDQPAKPAPDDSDKAASDQPAEGPSPTLTDILSHPTIAANGPKGGPGDAGNAALTPKQRRALPSYISARAFSRAVLDAALPDTTGATTLDGLKAQLEQHRTQVDTRLYDLLLGLLDETKGDIDRVRTRLETIYDEHMQRVSGWYKRHVRWITIGVGGALVLLLNLNAVRVASALYLDQPLRDAVVAQTQKPGQCTSTDPKVCLDQARAAVQPLASAGLPIGWKAVPDCAGKTPDCSWLARYGITTPTASAFWQSTLHIVAALLGYLLMALAVLPGARFWYSALDRLNVFRSSGERPAQTPATSQSNIA